MGIDRIGKSGGVVPPTVGEVGKATPAAGTGEAFDVGRAHAAAPATSLDRVRSGELTVPEYLDARVDAATSHLSGKLAPEQLDFVRASLREQLAADPVLVDLVKAATGAVPPARE